MALVVEDGTGKADAEAYISVADADAYHVAYGTTAGSWADLTPDSVKEIALRTAARYLDMMYRWAGVKSDVTNALDWPRFDVEDESGYYLDSTVIPEKLKQANAELAVRAAAGELFTDTEEGANVQASLLKVGPITIEDRFTGAKSLTKRYPEIDALLHDLIVPEGTIHRA